jgi:hypothetical protein
MKRRVSIWLAFAVAAGAVMFPPWLQVTGSVREYPAVTEKLWHAPLWEAPAASHKWASVYVDYPLSVKYIYAPVSC